MSLCQTLQGKFYSITGETIYKGMEIESLEEAQEQGLFQIVLIFLEKHIQKIEYQIDTSEIWEEDTT